MPKAPDPYWKYVTPLPKNFWRCNNCGHKARGGITRLRAHLHKKPGYGIIPCKAANPQESRGNLEGSSTFTQSPHQLGSASDKDDWMYDVMGTAGTSSLPFISVHETNFPNRSAQTMIQRLETPSQPQLTHAVDFDIQPHPSSSRDLTPVALTSIQSSLNARGGDLHTQGGDGGYQIHDCRVVNDQVGSEALQASNLTRVPYQSVFVRNENAQRDTSITPTAVAFSSAFVSVSHQSRSDQTHLRQSPDALDAFIGDSYHSSSLEFVTDDSANMQYPPNAEVRFVNPEVHHGKRARAADPLSSCVEVLNGHGGVQFIWGHSPGDGIDGSRVVDGGVRSEALQAYKDKRVVGSSNRHDNGEWSANITQYPLTASLSQGSNVAVTETNFPYHSHFAQTMNQERHPWNSYGPLNAGGGDLHIEVTQELGSAESEPSNRGLTDESRTSSVKKLKELINRFEDDMNKLRSKFEGMIEESSRSLAPEKLADVEKWMKKLENISISEGCKKRPPLSTTDWVGGT